jgi:putative PIN family toxin of toxin-antitoxin system
MRKVVIDTNCLLAILPTHSPYHQVWTDFVEGKLAFCVSSEILMEYEEILSQKTSAYFADTIIKALLNRSNLIKVSPTWFFHLITQDPDDNKFVDCAICGHADFLVSNDRHFKVLETIDFPFVNVIKLQDFICNL